MCWADCPSLWLLPTAHLTWVAYLISGADEPAAEQGLWRTSESTLHAVALLGGWPGARVAQYVFRHKTLTQPFRSISWVADDTNYVAPRGACLCSL